MQTTAVLTEKKDSVGDFYSGKIAGDQFQNQADQGGVAGGNIGGAACFAAVNVDVALAQRKSFAQNVVAGVVAVQVQLGIKDQNIGRDEYRQQD